MKAAVLHGPGRLSIEDVPSPDRPSNDYTRVKVLYVGVCGSDVSAYKGASTNVRYPVILGHEAVCVDEYGTFYAVYPYTNCFMGKRYVLCRSCNNGHYNSCENNQTYGVQRHGLMVEEAIVPNDCLAKIPKGKYALPYVLTEPLAVGYHAAAQSVEFCVNNKTALVIGCGAVGAGAALYFKKYGVNAFVADTDKRRADLLCSVLGTQQDTLGRYDIVVDAAGTEDSLAMAIEKSDGLSLIAAVGYKSGKVPVDINTIIKREITIVGCRNSTTRNFSNVMEMISNDLDILPLIGNMYDLSNAEKAITEPCNGIRSVVCIDKTSYL